MSESKWNDGRVLRSNETTLRLCEVRELYSLMRQGDNDIHDIEKIRDIGRKFKEVLGDYYLHCDELLMDARSKIRAGAPAQFADVEYNLKLEELDENEGQDFAADIVLQMSEWQWLMDRIKDRKGYSGDDRAIEKTLRIHDALTNAKGFQFVKDGDKKLVWVKGEPNPAVVNAFEENVAKEFVLNKLKVE